MIIMSNFKIQKSKDAFCDFLLVNLWQLFLENDNYNDEQDFDLVQNTDYVQKFIEYLDYLSNNKKALAQFNLHSIKAMQTQLTNAYHNLINNDVDF